MEKEKIKVLLIESDQFMGQKIFEIKYFDTLSEANSFIKDFNKNINNFDWYVFARLY